MPIALAIYDNLSAAHVFALFDNLHVNRAIDTDFFLAFSAL